MKGIFGPRTVSEIQVYSHLGHWDYVLRTGQRIKDIINGSNSVPV